VAPPGSDPLNPPAVFCCFFGRGWRVWVFWDEE
jgi:hypothetical protein